MSQSIEDENYLVLKINDHQTRGLLDSGSCRTIIKESFARKLNLKFRPPATGDRKFLYAAQGAKLHVAGYSMVEFNISGLIFNYEVCCVTNVEPNLILGVDIMRDNGIVCDYTNAIATVHGSLLQLPIYNPSKRNFFVRTTKTTVIPPLTECLVDVKVSDQFRNQTCMLQPVRLRQFKEYAVAHSVNRARGNHSVCSILNYQETPLVLPKNKVIAIASALKVNSEFQPLSDTQANNYLGRTQADSNESNECRISRDELEEFVAEYGFEIGAQLSDDERLQIMRLLFKYREVFARCIADTKVYPHYQEHIQIKSETKPFFKKQFRLKPQDAQALHQQIIELEKSGMVENCTSPSSYQTPVFGVVKKGTSTPRLVQDLRALNDSVIIKTVNLNPINTTLENIALQRARYFTVVDLKNAFWSIQLSPESRPYTSFVDPLTYERKQWCVTPMGYVNSSAALHTVINHVLSQQIGTLRLHTYADDLLSCSHSFSSHIADLENLFSTLLNANLRISPSKAAIATDNCIFLSHRLSADGILPIDDHLKLVKDFPQPTNKKSLMRFLGTVNWLKAFVPQLSQRTYYMRQLLRGNADFIWSEECQQEFLFIKAELANPRILHPIDVNKEFVFITDASKFGIAWAACNLSEKNELQLLGFGGNSLSQAQAKSWSSTELELAAVCSAISNFSCFLTGKTTHIISDNLAVCHLKTLKLQSARVRKMVIFLNQFNLTVRHISGRHNTLADSLSRCFAEMTEPVKLQFATPKLEIDEFIFNISPTNSNDSLKTESSQPASAIPRACAVQTRRQRTGEGSTLLPTTDPVIVNRPSDSSSDEQGLDEGTDSGETHMSTNPPPSSADRHETQEDCLPLIKITPEDYYTDDEFNHMYTYLKDGQLSGNDQTDRVTLLTASNFFYDPEADLLFKIALPTRHKQQRVTELMQTLCVPLKHRLSLLTHFHDQLGHFSHERLFLRLHEKFFWKSQFKDARDFSISCDRCQQTKRDYKPGVPLHPHETPSRPFEIIHFDLKNLTRPTRQQNKYLLVAVDSFSKYPFIEALPDSTALTCAKALVNIVAVTGVPRLFLSDRASYWTSEVIKNLMELLQVKHRVASSLNPQSNGAAERMIQSVASQIRLLADSDLDIEDVIPLVLINLRSAVNPAVQKSSHEIVFGSPMHVPNPLPVDVNCPKFNNDQLTYLKWLQQKLQFVHKGIAQNLTETKAADATAYNKRHHAVEPQFKTGDEVYLQDRRIKPRSDQIITHKNYSKRYIVVEKVESPHTGPAYRLADIKTGQTLKSLIAPHRLKLCLADIRADLQQRLSPTPAVRTGPAPPQPVASTDAATTSAQPAINVTPAKPHKDPAPARPKLEPAIKILKQQKRGPHDEMQYLVLFTNKSKYWCDRVTPLLLRNFRLHQAELRQKRKRRRTSN